MAERTVTVTDRDITFVRQAKEHYRVFAEAMEKQEGGERTAGVMRAQEFYAERFLARMEAPDA